MKWEEENVISLKISVQWVIIVMGWAVQGLLKNVPLAPSQMKHSKLPAVAHVVAHEPHALSPCLSAPPPILSLPRACTKTTSGICAA